MLSDFCYTTRAATCQCLPLVLQWASVGPELSLLSGEETTKAEIISVGTELLLGQLVDTNAAYLAGELPALGIDCYFISQVGDNLGRLTETLRRAWVRSDLVLVTGGLGPTEDDLTREAIAALLGEEMRLVPELEQELRARFALLRRELPPSNLKQATLIPSAQALPNPIGTAPGWWVERGESANQQISKSQIANRKSQIMVAMPGVPAEMRRMWREEVVPRLLARLGSHQVIVSRTLKVLGLPEAQAEEKVRPLMASPDPTVGIYAKSDGIHFRLTSKADSAAEARARIASLEAKFRERLGTYLYGADDDTPASVIGEQLRRGGKTVATLEFGTGGYLAGLLAEAPGSGDFYRGGLVAGSRETLVGWGVALADLGRFRPVLTVPPVRGAEPPAAAGEAPGLISPAGATALARAARTQLQADIGLGMVGVPGPAPSESVTPGTVHVALDDGVAARTGSLLYRTAPVETKRLGSLAALNLLRLYLLEVK
jgi:nicotinamide-nucleotide amidase